MKKQINGLLIEVFPPESPKFKSPLVFLHGLWSGSWCWRQWSTHFSNLGWECWVVNFRGRTGESRPETLAQLTLQDCLEDLRQVIHALASPPILLAHSLGGLVAQKAAEEEETAALILLSSLPPAGIQNRSSRPLRLLRLKYFPLMLLRRPMRIQDKDFSRYWLASLPEDQRASVLRSLVPESGHLVAELFHPTVSPEPGRIRCPVLVVAGGEDAVVPAAATRELAQRLGAELKEYPHHGHWMMGGEAGEETVRDIHRWIIQRLGETVLLAQLPES